MGKDLNTSTKKLTSQGFSKARVPLGLLPTLKLR